MKYIITKSDGTPVDPNARYFVLRLDDATRPDNKAARAALETYVREAREAAPEAARAAMSALAGTPKLHTLLGPAIGTPASTPPPAKEGWQHSQMVLVWYPGCPEAGKTDRFGVAYYHYAPPFEEPRWVDWDHPDREPRWWWPLPAVPNTQGQT